MAHVARAFVLARDLPRERFDVTFATDRRYLPLLGPSDAQCEPLLAVGSPTFLARTGRGQCVYTASELARYVEDDLGLIAKTKADVVVGDFRLSLSVSARVAGIPYLAVTNAYWDPRTGAPAVVPAHALTRLFGVASMNAVFAVMAPALLAAHARPMNALRRAYGLASLGGGFREVVLDADVRLFADPAELVPPPARDRSNVVLGPIAFSPNVAVPGLLDAAPGKRPYVYVALGSSGSAASVRPICDALDDLGCTVLLAMGGATRPPGLPSSTRAFDFLPGDRAARASKLVVCNGGSPAVHQALAEGTPVLGVPGNLDQLLNMFHVERTMVGATVRADRVTRARIRAAVRTLLSDPRAYERAGDMARAMSKYRPAVALADAIDAALSTPRARVRSKPEEVSA